MSVEMKIDCVEIVKGLINESNAEYTAQSLKQARDSKILWEKCVLLRKFTTPQSTDAEKLVRHDLKIERPLNNTSGDGIKNGIKYEIKVSLHDKRCNVNIRQIRPHHTVDFYIIIAFNLFEGELGKSFIFKIPENEIYKLISNYGGYTHGTVEVNGIITLSSILDKTNKFEYSLSPDPNATKGTKAYTLWEEFLKYEVEYHENNF
jgi:hypothetical protein